MDPGSIVLRCSAIDRGSIVHLVEAKPIRCRGGNSTGVKIANLDAGKSKSRTEPWSILYFKPNKSHLPY